MLNKNVFKTGMEMLKIEYGEGFNTSSDRLKQWYKYCEDMTDYEFNIRIDNILMNCTRVPSMADLFSEKNNNDNVPKRDPMETRLVFVIRENRPVPLAFCNVKEDETYYEYLEECIKVIRGF